MSQTLYRKYRPRTFAEVEGQEAIVQTLKGAVLSGRLGHAYLFSGPRGSGKTTIARVFAKAINCLNRKKEQFEPCNECSSCLDINEGRSLDIIEIDAASNRGIDEIRNLKDSAQTSASSSRFKIFIIDEVHMLTPQAFNALLKILEEPPAYVVFILATTEGHKVLDTILSRVQRFDFKKLGSEKIIRKLAMIAKRENIEVEKEVFDALAAEADGSLRDAESALAKLMSYTGGDITMKAASEILGLASLETYQDFTDAILNGQAEKALSKISEIYQSGVDLENFTKQFLKYLRLKLVEIVGKKGLSQQEQKTAQSLVKMINVFIKAREDFRISPIPQLPLELGVLELIDGF